MLFYNTILKTIRVSTSYNSYFGLMRQMYKKISFLQNKGIFLTKNIVLPTLAKYVRNNKKAMCEKMHIAFFIYYFLFLICKDCEVLWRYQPLRGELPWFLASDAF